MNWHEIVLITIKTTDENPKKEIIEIGLCNFNVKSLRKYDPISFFVKPTNSIITPECSKRTGIGAEDVSSAPNFFELCSFMRENYQTHKKPFASYGNFVELIFKDQWDKENDMRCPDYPLSNRFVNIRHLFPLVFAQKDEIGLKEALSKLKIPTSSNSCEDDVLNLGILFGEILRGGPLMK